MRLSTDNRISYSVDPYFRLMVNLSTPIKSPANPAKGWVPALRFAVLSEQGEEVGQLTFRLGDTQWLTHYAGHVGYHIYPPFRNRGFATQACRLLEPLALAAGFSTLWVTCNPANVGSRRVCEKLGAELMGIVDLPPGNDMYEAGERQKCRYRWRLAP